MVSGTDVKLALTVGAGDQTQRAVRLQPELCFLYFIPKRLIILFAKLQHSAVRFMSFLLFRRDAM